MRLAAYPDTGNQALNGRAPVIDMFNTISLYDLMKGVLVNPLENPEKKCFTVDDLIPFARTLVALGNMSQHDTKGAPLIILGINDPRFHVMPNESTAAEILYEIWKAGRDGSSMNNQYNCSVFGARITAAGYTRKIAFEFN